MSKQQQHTPACSQRSALKLMKTQRATKLSFCACSIPNNANLHMYAWCQSLYLIDCCMSEGHGMTQPPCGVDADCCQLMTVKSLTSLTRNATTVWLVYDNIWVLYWTAECGLHCCYQVHYKEESGKVTESPQ